MIRDTDHMSSQQGSNQASKAAVTNQWSERLATSALKPSQGSTGSNDPTLVGPLSLWAHEELCVPGPEKSSTELVCSPNAPTKGGERGEHSRTGAAAEESLTSL